jgi:SagB-type dehydrogenase family enzyme
MPNPAQSASLPISSAHQRQQELLPLRPRFLHETVVVPIEDGVIIEGTQQMQVLKGQAAQTVLPFLVSLMDGTRTVAELERSFAPTEVKHMHAVLSLLASCGLLEDGTNEPADNLLHDPATLAFLRRFLGATGINSSGPEAYRKLQSAEVAILGPRNILDSGVVQSLLTEAGIGQVTSIDSASLDDWFSKPKILSGQSFLLSICAGAEDCAWYEMLDSSCFDHQISWLRSAIDQDERIADLGPFFQGKGFLCYRCFREVHSPASSLSRSGRSHRIGTDLQFWFSMVAVEVAYLLTGIAPSLTGRDFIRYNLQEWTTQSLRCVRLPDCPRCSPIASPIAGYESLPIGQVPINTALVFEDYVGPRSRSHLTTRAQPRHSRTWSPLTRMYKQMPNCNRYVLNRKLLKLDHDVVNILCKDSAPKRLTLGLDELSTILMMTAGIRHDSGVSNNTKIQRWAATAGNLGSVEIFVAIHSVDGLNPGFYFYRPREHSLALFQMRADTMQVDDFISRVIPKKRHGLPEVLVLFTAAFHRITHKYGSFAYRLINLDAGASLSQLHLVARSLGLSSRTESRWADDLIEKQLNLEPFREQSTTVVSLSCEPRRTVCESKQQNLKPQSGIPPSAKLPREFCELQVSEVTKILYRESRIWEHELASPEFHVPDKLMPAQQDPCDPTSPPPICCGYTVGDVLSRRTSVRRYDVHPVHIDQLNMMLYCAEKGDFEDWPADRCDLPLKLLAMAWRVDGLDPGVYVYDYRSRHLSLAGGPLSNAQRKELFVQDEFAQAPLVIWIAGSLLAACARQGAFGHRRLLLRAGAAAHRVWMTALGMGLSGALVAGLIPGAAERYLGIDGYLQVSLLATAIGYEAKDSRSPHLQGDAVHPDPSETGLLEEHFEE